MAKERVRSSLHEDPKKIGATLSERAMLVNVHITTWSARKMDKDISDEVTMAKNADLTAGRFSKILVPKKALTPINKASSLARNIHRELTLPWADEGDRILTTKGYEHYDEQMRLAGKAFRKAVKKFLEEYPDHVKNGRKLLGDMYDPEEYPDEGKLKGKFSYDVEIKPVPIAGDFRAKVSEQEARIIGENIEKRTIARIENATKDVWQRIADMAKSMYVKLTEYEPPPYGKNTFRSSLVDNIKKMAELLPALNITNDEHLDAMQKLLLEDLCAHDTDELRKDGKLRSKTAKKAEAIFRQVKDYLN